MLTGSRFPYTSSVLFTLSRIRYPTPTYYIGNPQPPQILEHPTQLFTTPGFERPLNHKSGITHTALPSIVTLPIRPLAEPICAGLNSRKTGKMLDLLLSMRAMDGTANDNTPKCAWQDLPGSFKLDNDGKEVALTAAYKNLLRRLKDGAPLVLETLAALATAADKANHLDAARDARVASGWLGRLSERDFTTTTWDSDYSRLDGFWVCLRDAEVALETAFQDDGHMEQQSLMSIVGRYVDDLTQLQPEVDRIEHSRTTLVQKVLRRLSGTMTALRGGEVVTDDDFWNEESVAATTR